MSPSILDRAIAYAAAMGPAIQGQIGSTHTYKVAIALVHGFALSQADAASVLNQWNSTCLPPWSEGELAHKFSDAAKVTPQKNRGEAPA